MGVRLCGAGVWLRHSQPGAAAGALGRAAGAASRKPPQDGRGLWCRRLGRGCPCVCRCPRGAAPSWRRGACGASVTPSFPCLSASSFLLLGALIWKQHWDLLAWPHLPTLLTLHLDSEALQVSWGGLEKEPRNGREQSQQSPCRGKELVK